MNRLLLMVMLLVAIPSLAQSLGPSLSQLFRNDGLYELEMPACLLASDLVVESGCGLLSCFTGSPTQESDDNRGTRSTAECRGAGSIRGMIAAGGGEPPEQYSGKKHHSYEELLAELRRILEILIQLIRSNESFLVLSLDIDRTVYYPGGPVGLHSAYSNLWGRYLNQLRSERRLLLIYNTVRGPGTMTLQGGWPDSTYPRPDVLIMDGSHIEYSQFLQQQYPGLQNVVQEMPVDWPDLESEKKAGASIDQTGSYCRVICSPGRQADQIAQRMQAYCAGRSGCSVWRQNLSELQREVVFSYSHNLSKGAGLSRVMSQLNQQQVFGLPQVLLITGGDDLPDSSMMNSRMRFPGSQGAPSFELPGSVQFVGSVVPYDANLLVPGVQEELLSEATTVTASEASLLGIQKGIVELLQRHFQVE